MADGKWLMNTGDMLHDLYVQHVILGSRTHDKPEKLVKKLLVLVMLCAGVSAQDAPDPLVIPFPDNRLTVNGLPWFAENGNSLSRLPVRAKDTFRLAVWGRPTPTRSGPPPGLPRWRQRSGRQ